MIQTVKMAELPEVSFWKKQEGADWFVGISIGGDSHVVARFWSERMADEEIRSMKSKMQVNVKRTARELRKCKPAHVPRNLLQAYIMAMSKERCACFLETIFTINVLLHMLTYCFDEAEGFFDEFIDSPVRQSYAIAKKQINRMIDGLYATRLLGENDSGYEAVSAVAYKLLDMVNVLANYGVRDKDAFRMNEVIKTMQRVMPDDVLLREREDAADKVQSYFREEVTRYINAVNPK